MAELGKYQDEQGRVFSMTAEHAEKVGFKPVEAEDQEEEDAETKASDQAEDKALSGPASKKSASKSASKK